MVESLGAEFVSPTKSPKPQIHPNLKPKPLSRKPAPLNHPIPANPKPYTVHPHFFHCIKSMQTDVDSDSQIRSLAIPSGRYSAQGGGRFNTCEEFRDGLGFNGCFKAGDAEMVDPNLLSWTALQGIGFISGLPFLPNWLILQSPGFPGITRRFIETFNLFWASEALAALAYWRETCPIQSDQ